MTTFTYEDMVRMDLVGIPAETIILGDVAFLTERALASLSEYSCTMPTGTTVGKRWKCAVDYYDRTKGWLLCEYLDHPDPSLVGVGRYRVVVIPADRPRAARR